jgi:hypothetical protein
MCSNHSALSSGLQVLRPVTNVVVDVGLNPRGRLEGRPRAHAAGGPTNVLWATMVARRGRAAAASRRGRGAGRRAGRLASDQLAAGGTDEQQSTTGGSIPESESLSMKTMTSHLGKKGHGGSRDLVSMGGWHLRLCPLLVAPYY